MKLLKSKICHFMLLLVLLAATNSLAQPRDDESKLADHYFSKGEYEKAEIYYKNVYKKYDHPIYFEKYYLTLFYQKKYEDAEKLVEKRIKQNPLAIEPKFLLGQLYEETERAEQAGALYDKMIKEMPSVQSEINALGMAFKVRGKYDYTLKTYQAGKEAMKRGYGFQLELAEVYSLMDQPENMIQEYLNLLDYSQVYLKTIQTYLSRVIDFEQDEKLVEILRVELLSRVQKDPESEPYAEMLIWFYLHKREFNSAVIQAKALDKRKGLNGKRLFAIGEICEANEEYKAASKSYQYIIDIGTSSPYYSKAIEQNLRIGFYLITNQKSYTRDELKTVEANFESALTSLGKSQSTLGILIQQAEINAFYLNDTEKAENLVKEGLNLSLTNLQKARLKILLGDIYIVSDKIWDASLLYMQVEKQFSEDIIGHEAKFKNAKVFYYDGEFEYAKAQLDVLKASTSKLIANDAMQLSLLLQDNLGIDTTLAPVQLYATADLLLQQNRYADALLILDSLEAEFPFHGIIDEVIFKKAQIYEEMQNWTKAIELYDLVIDSYGHDILADDAAYKAARIYEYKLSQNGKAAVYYKKILFDFKGSLYDAEARKKFREIKAGLSEQELFDLGLTKGSI